MTLEEIFALAPEEAIAELKKKKVVVPAWEELSKAYNVVNHPVEDKQKYQDEALNNGLIDEMTRVTYSLPKLLTKRMTGFCFGIPIKREYTFAEEASEQQYKAQQLIEKIYKANRINSINISRFKKYFAGCEILTIWYMTEGEEPHTKYGVETKMKLRCKTYSPMDGYAIYPLFDSTGDYIAVSIEYTEKEGEVEVKYFETYTDTQHIQYVDRGDGYAEELKESFELGKNPTIYIQRDEAIFEDSIKKVYEIEWSTSRAGNYLRKNTSPTAVVDADEVIKYGDEDENYNSGNKNVMQLPKGSGLTYATWQMNISALEYYNKELRDMAFTESQIPDISFKEMYNLNLSGEAFDRIFMDVHLKVLDESGVITEALDREFNVIRAFAKVIDSSLSEAIDSLDCEQIVTPFSIRNESEEIKNFTLANGGKALMSQEESIRSYGKSKDVGETMKLINQEREQDNSNPTAF